jgi:hypothetical protein
VPIFEPDVLAAILDSQRGSRILIDRTKCQRIFEEEGAGPAAERPSTISTGGRLTVEPMEGTAGQRASPGTGDRLHPGRHCLGFVHLRRMASSPPPAPARGARARATAPPPPRPTGPTLPPVIAQRRMEPGAADGPEKGAVGALAQPFPLEGRDGGRTTSR